VDQRDLSERRLKEGLVKDQVSAAQRELGFQECLEAVDVWLEDFRGGRT
jgi:hypothetical protein